MLLSLNELIFAAPSGLDVAWEDLNNEEWDNITEYRGDENLIYCDMNLEEQFMFLCFIVLAQGGEF